MSGYLTPPEWTSDALCPQTDPAIFFPPKGVNGAQIQAAKNICAACDVRELCLQAALDNDERFGIWGGLTERERRKIPHGRRCKRCDEIFSPTNPAERFCSDDCRAASRRRTIEKVEKVYGCIQCGAKSTSLRCAACSHRYRVELVQPRQAARAAAA